MDDVAVQVVQLHNSSREERVSKLFSFAWVDYEVSVIVPYVTMVLLDIKFLSVLKWICLPGFCCFVNLSAGMADTTFKSVCDYNRVTAQQLELNKSCVKYPCLLLIVDLKVIWMLFYLKALPLLWWHVQHTQKIL